MERRKAINSITVIGSAILLSACSPKPYAEAEKSYKKQLKNYITSLKEMTVPALIDSAGKPIPSAFIATTNFNVRKANYVIIHYTAQDSTAQTLKTFTLPRTQVSAHYVVGKDGKVIHMLNDHLRAWHAGNARWGNDTDINSASIGIELDNNGKEPFADAQINSLLALLATLKKSYSIPTANFIGHADIAPTRKPDPGVFFPWQKLADKGFGLWYDNPNQPPPADFNAEEALRRIGYDTSNLSAAITAFKLHFIKTDLKPVLTDWDKCVLWNLYKKY